MIQTYRLQGWGPNPPILEVPPPLSVPNFALANILARFDSVSLTTVAQSLMERVDTKFLLSLPTLEVLLPELVDSYAVLDIEGRRIFDYDNLYLDTSNLDFYHLHQRGAYSRFKVRLLISANSRVGFATFAVAARWRKKASVLKPLPSAKRMSQESKLSPSAGTPAKGHKASGGKLSMCYNTAKQNE